MVTGTLTAIRPSDPSPASDRHYPLRPSLALPGSTKPRNDQGSDLRFLDQDHYQDPRVV
jgi:hypothetical protein